MAALTLLEGPAGSNKSGAAMAMLRAGEADGVADVTALWAAVSGAERDRETGRYPERSDDDPTLPLARIIQTATVSAGLRQGLRMVTTTSRRGQAQRWADLAAEHKTDVTVRTMDPGVDVVVERLATEGREVRRSRYLSRSCGIAASRWYGSRAVRESARRQNIVVAAGAFDDEEEGDW